MKRSITPLFLLGLLFLCFQIFPQRLISLAPGITEIIFKLGSGNRLIGVTKFCDYPKETKHINKIGGFIDLNLEEIISLKPDIIFHYPEHYEKIKIFNKKVKLISLEHKSLKDLYRSIETIAIALNKKKKGNQTVKVIKKKLYKIAHKTKGIKKKVLIIISRDPFHLRNMIIIGKGDYLNEILKYSGGKNCYKGKLNYPTVSIESVINMNPDIIIEFIYFLKKSSSSEIIMQWNKFNNISAVLNKKIFIVKDQFWLRPGPRVTLIAEKLFNIINKKQ